MTPADRTALMHGPYAPPPARVGGWLTCRLQGRVRVGRFAEAPLPSSLARNALNGGRGRGVVVLCGDLERALRAESS